MKKRIKNKENIFDWDSIDDFSLSRWAALVEAVNIIAEKAEDRGVNFKKISFKQNALKKYVDITGDIICRRIQENSDLKEKKENDIHVNNK